uniref:DM10 domain-containing protein n=1 Tax=Trichogramma kaykai TaxID=54128 RepID=A0ABD2XF13_9HYME
MDSATERNDTSPNSDNYGADPFDHRRKSQFKVSNGFCHLVSDNPNPQSDAFWNHAPHSRQQANLASSENESKIEKQDEAVVDTMETLRNYLTFEAYPRNQKTRLVKIIYYIEDDSMMVCDEADSGNIIVKKQRVLMPSGDGFYKLADFNVSRNIEINQTVYHIYSCDDFTREYLTNNGVNVNVAEEQIIDDEIPHRHKEKNSSLMTDHQQRIHDYEDKTLTFDAKVSEGYCFTSQEYHGRKLTNLMRIFKVQPGEIEVIYVLLISRWERQLKFSVEDYADSPGQRDGEDTVKLTHCDSKALDSQLYHFPKVLRYSLVMDHNNPEGRDRDFVLEYNTADGCMRINEVDKKNSGRRGGCFLGWNKVPKPDDKEHFYGTEDFLIGERLNVFGHHFIIAGTEMFVWNYMRFNREAFSDKVRENIKAWAVNEGLIDELVDEKIYDTNE